MSNTPQQEIRDFFKLSQVPLNFHIPILASLCVAMPLIIGFYLENIKAGMTVSMAGLIVVYFNIYAPTAQRIITLLACSFAFIFSYAVGLAFSFNHLASSIALGVFSMIIHWMASYLKLKPPKSFFFIMLASISGCIPYNRALIAERLGLVAIGAIFTVSFALIYSLGVNTKKDTDKQSGQICIIIEKNSYADFAEAAIMGLLMFACLQLGFILNITNPYWIPVSCCAVMQGVSRSHVWKRVLQRIVGTFFGLVLCWFILMFAKNMLALCVAIFILQFILEIFIPRNYAIAIMFATPLTILLAEASDAIINNATSFILIRFSNTVIGSLIGILGGWLIYHEKIRFGKKSS